MYRILLCEDDKHEKTRLENFLASYFNAIQRPYHLASYEKAIDAKNEALNNTMYDIALLDIIMPEYTGLQLSKDIRKRNDECKIVFITSSKEFAIESYEVHASNYILKPFKENKMKIVLDKIIKELDDEDRSYVVLNSKFGHYRVKHKDIIYLESFKRQVMFHLNNGDTITLNGKLDSIEELLHDERFLRCHKSYLVNMDYIAKLENRQFIFLNGDVVPIPKESLNTTKQVYFNFLYNKIK